MVLVLSSVIFKMYVCLFIEVLIEVDVYGFIFLDVDVYIDIYIKIVNVKSRRESEGSFVR